jgi:hypothetical protein
VKRVLAALLALLALVACVPPPPEDLPRLVLLGDSLLADAGDSVAIDRVWVVNAGVGGSGLFSEAQARDMIARLDALPIQGATVGLAWGNNVDTPDNLDAPDNVVAERYAENLTPLLARLRELGAARVVWLEPPPPLWPNVVRVPPTRPKAVADAIVARHGLERYRIGRCPAPRPDGLHFAAEGSVMYGRTASAAAWQRAELCVT